MGGVDARAAPGDASAKREERPIAGVLTALLAILALAFGAAVLRRWFAAGAPFSIEGAAVGGALNFLDVLGIGCFAPMTAWLRRRRLAPDPSIPPMLMAANALAAIASALIFVRIIAVDPPLLVVCVVAALTGSVLASRAAFRLPARTVRLAMGAGLLLAAALTALGALGLLPADGSALALDPLRMTAAAAACFVFGMLMNVGIGFYAPALATMGLLGLDLRAAFPIMAGACAFLMPAAGFRVLERPEIDIRIVASVALGSIPGVLAAAYLVKELPLGLLRWLVVAIVAHTGVGLLIAAARMRREVPVPAQS